MWSIDVLRSSILLTLREGDILPGFTKALSEILKYPELLGLWPDSTYDSRRSEMLPAEARSGFEKLEVAIFSATTVLEIAAMNIDDAAFEKLLADVRAQGINLVEEQGIVGLRGDFGWLALFRTNWPG
jgi:hypothetical protein